MAHILIIDDDKDICLTLSRFLIKNGYQVEIAGNGEDGLQILRNHSIDLILCDYRLPDYTGLEVLQKIKILSPKSAVVIITGYSFFSRVSLIVTRSSSGNKGLVT